MATAAMADDEATTTIRQAVRVAVAEGDVGVELGREEIGRDGRSWSVV